jgi:hypothetical protein
VRVVVEFETDADAEAKAFVKAALQNDIYASFGEWLEGIKGYPKVVAAYKKPTKFCEPQDGHRGTKTTGGWTRGKKYGWWVCGVCGKPTKRWATGDIWHYSMGYNLLPPSISPLERGARSTLEWTEEELGWVSSESSVDCSPSADS